MAEPPRADARLSAPPRTASAGPDRAPQQLRELVDAASLVGRRSPPEEARVELVGDLGVLEPLGEPVEDTGHEVGRQVVADLAPLDAPADERLRAVRSSSARNRTTSRLIARSVPWLPMSVTRYTVQSSRTR